MIKDDGGPAFPRVENNGLGNRHVCVGMTLRDYFAAKAMPELNWPGNDQDVCAELCYQVADAMLRAREK
jgi:hypothetical protein